MESLDYFPVVIAPVTWVEQSDALQAIRRQVFVVEQGIPDAEEFDGQDAAAQHWLASTTDGAPIGCARLLGDRIGRLAVLPEYRRRGVGAALLRWIIRDALACGQGALQLHAQTQTLGFYEALGFEPRGEEFLEAGISHRLMVLPFGNLLAVREQPAPPVSEAERRREVLEGAAAIAECVPSWIPRALRRACILSTRLDPEIYDSDAVRDAVLEFATSHPQAEVLMLVREPQALARAGHRLVRLAQRLSSHVQLRALPPACATPEDEFLVTDTGAVLCWQHARPLRGYGVRHAPADARRLIDAFQELWNLSEEAPELRRLAL
ncbi:MAG: GNAT family N-acetyltransferase [Gammaproteobacteria bacterium]|nr:GNAT family N-acetyltransferase [Gammaproteobacteria bacterium]